MKYILTLLLLSIIFRNNAQNSTDKNSGKRAGVGVVCDPTDSPLWSHLCHRCKSGIADITGHCIKIKIRKLIVRDMLIPRYGIEKFWIQANDLRTGDSLSMIVAPQERNFPNKGDTLTYTKGQIELGDVKWKVLSLRSKHSKVKHKYFDSSYSIINALTKRGGCLSATYEQMEVDTSLSLYEYPYSQDTVVLFYPELKTYKLYSAKRYLPSIFSNSNCYFWIQYDIEDLGRKWVHFDNTLAWKVGMKFNRKKSEAIYYNHKSISKGVECNVSYDTTKPFYEVPGYNKPGVLLYNDSNIPQWMPARRFDETIFNGRFRLYNIPTFGQQWVHTTEKATNE